MSLNNVRAYLPDVNVLIALTDREHEGFSAATEWFHNRGKSEWMLCPLTESGFIRLASHPSVGGHKLRDAISLLRQMMELPGFRYLPILDPWLSVTAPLQMRLQGYKQVTDAYLLGLAIKEDAVLVTLDLRLAAWAPAKYGNHLLSLG